MLNEEHRKERAIVTAEEGERKSFSLASAHLVKPGGLADETIR